MTANLPSLLIKSRSHWAGKKVREQGTKGNRMSKIIVSPFNIMYTREIDQLVRFFILYIIWLTCSFRQITFQGWLRDKWNTYLYLIREKWRWNPKNFFLICFGLVLLNLSLFNTQQYSALAFQSWWTKWPIKNFSLINSIKVFECNNKRWQDFHKHCNLLHTSLCM